MSLEQRVAEAINAAMFWSDSTVEQAAAQVIALCRDAIAGDIEAERDRISKTDGHYRAALEEAARIARNGAST